MIFVLTLSLDLPAYVRSTWDDKGNPSSAPEGVARWSRTDDVDPPPLGALVRVGRWGGAVVTAYFVSDGWLGVRATLLDPPRGWFEGHAPVSEHTVCCFGSEFELMAEPQASNGEIGLVWRDHPDGRAFHPDHGSPLVGEHLKAIALMHGFTYDASHACYLTRSAADAFALAARLRANGYRVTHAGCYGDDGPESDGLRKWWSD